MASAQITAINAPIQPRSAPKRAKPLSGKLRAFVTAYLTSFNATEAALAAGYGKKSSHAIGSRLLKKPLVAAAIDAELEKRGISIAYVVNSLKAIADNDKTRNADKIAALSLLGRNVGAFADKLDINITHDLADRVAQARERMTQENTSLSASASVIKQLE